MFPVMTSEATIQGNLVALSALPDRLQVLALLFLSHNGALLDSEHASSDPRSIAEAFHQMLLEHRYIAEGETRKVGRIVRAGVREFMLDQDRPLPHIYPHSPEESIVVSQVGDLFFHWTARALDSSAPVPLVWRSPLHV